ncbi:MAG: hypothetical protein HY289_05840 [Planctomycetes bacterium]|nr:hypothetical protein [Planctomycetota bacterium]
MMLAASPAAAQTPKRIQIGIEYAMPGLGKPFAELGVPAVKPYAEALMWGKMQKAKDAAIDFSFFDRVVHDYQDAGFEEIYISICTRCGWGNKGPKNLTPKDEHYPAFEAWVKAIVERYNLDKKNHMPGLKRSIRYWEVGTEYSSYQPEPTKEYLDMLRRSHKVIKAANPKAVVLHAAFLTTTVFKDHPKPAQYAQAFAAAPKRFMDKSLADIRAVLDHPEWFDAVNFHALGDPYEIEDNVAWLKWEMGQRKYSKPIFISDTTPTPFIAWGSATEPKSLFKGIVIPPATEADRERMAVYFKKLLDKDQTAIAWNHSFVASDMVKKCVIAAEQGVALINTSFMEDLFLFQLKLPLAPAGTGTSAWAGMADVKIDFKTEQRTILGKRPSFYAIKQLQAHLKGYENLQRVKIADERVRLYKWTQNKTPIWIAWLETGKLILPGDAVPKAKVKLKVPDGAYRIEPAIHDAAVKMGERIDVLSGIEIEVTPRPVYVIGTKR